MTVIQEMFGIKGDCGALRVTPRLMAEQFDGEGRAQLRMLWGGCRWQFVFVNSGHLEYGDYKVGAVYLDGGRLASQEGCVISAGTLKNLDRNVCHELLLELQ